MIDKDAFIAGIAVLAGAFGREVDAPVQRAYYAVLSREMTTEEFEQAVTLTLSSETFWPSPAVLLGKVKADETSRGLLALEHVNRITDAHGGFRYLPYAVYQAEFDAPTKAAISACGGLSAIATTNENALNALRKKFAAAYATAQKPPQLSAPPTDPRVRQLVRETTKALTSGRDRAAGRDE
jgi:hypothetical protein